MSLENLTTISTIHETVESRVAGEITGETSIGKVEFGLFRDAFCIVIIIGRQEVNEAGRAKEGKPAAGGFSVETDFGGKVIDDKLLAGAGGEKGNETSKIILTRRANLAADVTLDISLEVGREKLAGIEILVYR